LRVGLEGECEKEGDGDLFHVGRLLLCLGGSGRKCM